jgi:CBS domain-containing protein
MEDLTDWVEWLLSREEIEMADMPIKEVMTNLVVMLYPNESIHEASQRLSRNGVSGAPVVESGKVIGIVSESDLIRALMVTVSGRHSASITDIFAFASGGGKHTNRSVADVMSAPVTTISPDESVWRAASVMERKGIKRLPVVDEDGFLIGIISRADIVKAMARSDDELSRDVQSSIEVLGEETIEDLSVSVADGVAMIAGTADRRSTWRLAGQLASRTPGIVRVINQLEFEVDDSDIKAVRRENDPKDPNLDWHSADAVHGVAR